MEPEKKGLILSFIASLIFGLSITLNKYFLIKTSFLEFMSLRFLFASLAFLVLLVLRKKLDFRVFDKIQWLYISGISLSQILFSLAFFYGLSITLATHASFFYIGLPILSLLIGVFLFRREINGRRFLIITLWVFGIIMVYLSRMEQTELWNSAVGDLVVIGSLLFLSLESFLMKKSMIKDEDKIMVFLTKYLSGAFLISLAVLISSGLGTGLNISSVLYSFLSSILMVGSLILWDYSIKITENLNVFPILVAPIVTFISSLLVFREPAGILQVLGYIFILGSVWLFLKKSFEGSELFNV